MLRRFFRIALTLGILGGLAAALRRMLGAGQGSVPAPAPSAGPLPRQAWPPLEPDHSEDGPSHDTRLQPDPEAPPAPAATRASTPEREAEPMPAPTDAPAPVTEAEVAWVEPDGDVCPTTHPVKAKLASKIFHVEGGLSYARVKPDRCYRDPSAAEADGLRPAKR